MWRVWIPGVGLLCEAAPPAGETYTAAERRHWAFQPRAHPAVPEFASDSGRQWVRNPVDAFILAKLQKRDCKPAPPASRRTLIRRVYFDLTGLPPSPEEVARFVADRSPDAWPRLVDRLLTSPEYGERWAQHWLDVVRFAESDGFEYDTHRAEAWRYRDYVIRSVSEDKPYDQFLREQLAGDEIDSSSEDLLVAAGFHRLGAVAQERRQPGRRLQSQRSARRDDQRDRLRNARRHVSAARAATITSSTPSGRRTTTASRRSSPPPSTSDIPRYTPEQQAEWKKKTAAIEAD